MVCVKSRSSLLTTQIKVELKTELFCRVYKENEIDKPGTSWPARKSRRDGL